ncbi:MAG: peptidylprolyl isomerase [Pseudomonadota bacterium]
MMKHVILKPFLVFLAYVCLSVAQVSAAPIANKVDRQLNKTPMTLNRIVAVVNDDIITLSELDDRKRIVLGQLKKQGTPVPADDLLSRQVLERMIADKVQLQLAKETGIKVDDTQLDRTMQRIAEDNRMTLGEFRTAIEKDGMSFTTFREDIRNEILLTRLREREVDNTITVTESEVEAELATESSRRAQENEYRLQHILISVPDQATSQQIQAKRNRAELAATALARGTDFGQVVATYSEAPDALTGGNLGWRGPSRLPGMFVEAIAKMKPGAVSPILKSPNGFHIFKLLDQRSIANNQQLVTQTHVRHILLRSKDGASDADMRQRLEILKSRIDSGEDFAAIARLQSEDGSAPKGGDLGWIVAGETVPEFERVMNELKPGQLSPPVKSPFGWHLIQVVERRESELSGDKRKLAIRQALRARKADDAYQDWLRQLRDRAYVEDKLEEK